MKQFLWLVVWLPMLSMFAAEPGFARSVIEVWVWGGPSQLDTFDPKPDAGRDYNGGYGAIPTNVEGIYVSEFMPQMAKIADKYSIIRSMTHGNNGHETATYLMQTGRPAGGGVVYPAIGAVVAMFKSKDYHGKLPPYVVLTVPKGRFAEVGFLNEKYSPLVTGGDPNAKKFAVDGIVPPGDITADDIRKRFTLLADLDTLGKSQKDNAELKEFDRCGAEALEMMTGDTAKIFDLDQETPEMRDRYGRNSFGQACLAARRLVEAGVPYVTINAQGWDSHKRHFETMKQKTAEMDQAMAALLTDLDQKKLLDSTIVWWSGEFGRTPKVDWNQPWNGGRNHFGACFSAVVAGGGFAGGKVIGKSSATGEAVAERPVYPQDLLGSIYERCGIDPDGPLPNPMNQVITVLPPAKGGRLYELYQPVKP